MFRNAYQSGLLSIFYSCGAKPLELWEAEVKNGHIKRLTDSDIRSIVLEIRGSNVSTTFITCPKGNKPLGIILPYMVMVVKNLQKHFTFEVTIMDLTGARRRFRISNFLKTTQILPLCTTMPIALSDGWNQIQFNLAEFTKRSYKTQFKEVVKLKINANIRLRRVYFAETLLPDDQLPAEYKLYIPLPHTKSKKIEEFNGDKENVNPVKSTTSLKVIYENKGSKEASNVLIRTVKRSTDRISKANNEQKLNTEAIDEKSETTDALASEPAESKPVKLDGETITAEGPNEPEEVVETKEDEAAPVEIVAGKTEPVDTVPIETVQNEPVPTEPVSAAEALPVEEPAKA